MSDVVYGGLVTGIVLTALYFAATMSSQKALEYRYYETDYATCVTAIYGDRIDTECEPRLQWPVME